MWFFPRLKHPKSIIFCIYFFAVLTYFFYFSKNPKNAIVNNEFANEIPIFTTFNETKIAVEDLGKRMETFVINFKDLKLKYHIKSDERIVVECKNKVLLIIIPSRPENFKQRIQIRNSWLAEIPSTVIYRFIIGLADKKETRILTKNESITFNDLIITDFSDNYESLSLKIHAGYSWQQKYCPTINYILKNDDDSVVNVNRLLYWMKKDFDFVANENSMKTLFCRVLEGEMPSRDPKRKWYIPEYAWPHSYFPAYCNGPSYLSTSTAIKQILEQTSNFFYITVEDVFFTGILAEAAKIKRIQRKKIIAVRDKINPAYYGCDEMGVPYITSTYHINSDKFDKIEEKRNLIKATFERIKGMECPNYILSLYIWIFI